MLHALAEVDAAKLGAIRPTEPALAQGAGYPARVNSQLEQLKDHALASGLGSHQDREIAEDDLGLTELSKALDGQHRL